MKTKTQRFAFLILLVLHGLQLNPSANAQPAQAPVITNQPVDKSFFEGQPATFTAGAVGTAPLSYQWMEHMNSYWRIDGATNSTYSFNSAQYYGYSGVWFYVIVTNVAGSIQTSMAFMRVYGLPLTEPSSASVFIGQDATFNLLYQVWAG
jgi:hypothetical protein